MIKKFIILLIISCFLASCGTPSEVSVQSSEEISEEEVIPENAILDSKETEISLANAKIKLPNGYKVGKLETSYGTAFYVWKAEKEYVLPYDDDIIFCAFEGVDITTPAEKLSDSNAKISIDSYINQTFYGIAQNPRLYKDSSITAENQWFNLVFTALGGIDNEITTYGEYCYPKTYYGFYLLSQDFIGDSHSRVWYGFVFTNDSKGELPAEEEYISLLNEIKQGFNIQKFYTPYQSEYDEKKDYSKGYTYEQFQNLFAGTKNYYIIKQEKENASSSEDVTNEVNQ